MTRVRERVERLLSAVWPAVVGSLAVVYSSLGDGAWSRRSAIGWMMGSWGARLAVQRLYARGTAPSLDLQASAFRLLILAPFFSLPAFIASRNPDPSLTMTELVASGVWLLGFAGETTADRQMLRFRSLREHDGLPCRSGLWRVVPEAHAVFEALIWTAFGLFASASPWGWIAWSCPAAMICLLFGVRRLR